MQAYVQSPSDFARPADIYDGPEHVTSNERPNTLMQDRDRVGSGKYLLALFVQQKVIVAEVLTRHVPVKILRFQVQREYIGEQRRERPANILCGVRPEVRWRAERSHLPCLCILNVHRSSLLVISPIRRIEHQSFFCAMPKLPRG
jgi:hypothetical protein